MTDQPLPPPPPPPPVQKPPGWYPDQYGQMRWWDGHQWGQLAQGGQPGGMDPKTMAVLAHALGMAVGFLAPLIIYLVNGEKDPYVRHHSAEALNFHITTAIGYVVSVILMFVLIGFFTFFAVLIAHYVFMIIAAVAASRGEWYRYPLNIRFVPGARGG